jgi:hypothetical protein
MRQIDASTGKFCHMLLDHFGFMHVLDHFVLVSSDGVGLLDLDAVNVLLMLYSSQLATLNSFELVIQTCIFE